MFVEISLTEADSLVGLGNAVNPIIRVLVGCKVGKLGEDGIVGNRSLMT